MRNHARYRGQISGTGGVVGGTAASFGDTVKLQRIGELCYLVVTAQASSCFPVFSGRRKGFYYCFFQNIFQDS